MKEDGIYTKAVEDYLKTIYKLQVDENPVSTTQIANELGISGASVTGMLKRLSEMRSKHDNNRPIVDYNSYKGVRLTEEGELEALNILRRHRLIELFLKNSLGFSLAKVHEESCNLEHCVSDEFIDKIDEILGYPKYSPLGNPIPTKDGTVPPDNSKPLTNVELNNDYEILKIADDNKEMVAYFEEMGFVPGLKMRVLSRAPFNGPISIEYNNQSSIIGYEIGKNIFVNPA
ncbi:MAG: metal-dependent transcriptional regulator [Candidatus Kapaibacterium sp.]|jgi:DtxR family Mn-dependent transcriptional regulator|nr:metal-dependent transcriptional regulator [Candidatus Kapabacteria bacterium]